jgi:hypothetical protein
VRLVLGFGYLNPTTSAPLLRRLLDLNLEVASGCYFALEDTTELVLWGTTRPTDGLDLVEFTGLCEQVAAGYREFCTSLVQDFQLDTQPR